MTRFAAGRAADQVSFGATPALVGDLSQQGLDAWITTQFALPPTQMTAPAWVVSYDTNNQEQSRKAYSYAPAQFVDSALSQPDQLRLRVTWALLQYIPVNTKVAPYALVEYFNLLQRHAFGNYGAFLRDLTISPAMGAFLDNGQNRPHSDECPWCMPNENYARELMQLFTLGVVKLNVDGSIVRSGNGRPVETYTQEDVEDMAAALTGWRYAPGTNLPNSNWLNAGVPMVPETWAALHDSRAKTVLGTQLPAGRTAPQDLDGVVGVLMQHPNIGPFVSLRLIQHLVTSNPSPAYVARVATVFRNNGQGVAGDMKAVIRAILLDPEARQADVPGAASPRVGKFREPLLWYTGMLRGLGCTKNLVTPWDKYPLFPWAQVPFNAASVFSYYLPTDRAPGSNLLAPEQKLVSADELTFRLGSVGYVFASNLPENAGAGCDLASLARAYESSPATLADEISRRWFKGAMPPTLRSSIVSLATGERNFSSSTQAALVLTQYALSSPFYGVMK